MEKATIKELLEKYFQAETTLEEEKVLAEYFRELDEQGRGHGDPDLEYGDPDLEQGNPDPKQDDPEHADPDPELAAYRDLFLYFAQEKQVTAGPELGMRILQKAGLAVRPVRTFRFGFIAAAAAIGAIVAGLFLLTPRRTQPGPATVASVTIKDTYNDPEQAMAAIRHALLVASTHLNEGRESLTGSRSLTGSKK